MRLVKLKEDDERFGMKAGDVLEVEPYWLDPSDKLTVIRRVSDGFDPGCNVYRSQVTVVNPEAKHEGT
jgi:hypothetical protein